MAQGEAGNGCADEEVSPLTGGSEPEPPVHGPPTLGTTRWVCGIGPRELDPPVLDEEPEPDDGIDPDDVVPDGSTVLVFRGTVPSTCLTDLHGWAGAHRHGGVRPTRRKNRRQRPPRRWC